MAEGDDKIDIPDYDPSSGLYSMKLWHNGQVVKRDGVVEYWNGKYVVIDNCDYDKMSIVELDSIIKEQLGYKVAAVYYVKVPGTNDLQYVETDDWLMRCLDQCLLFSRLVEVYYSHPIDPPVVPDVPLRVGHPQLEWHGQEDVHGEDNGEEEAPADPELRDSDYSQSEEGEPVNNDFDGLLRRRKGKGIYVELEEGFLMEDSDSDSDAEYGTKNRNEDCDSDSHQENEEDMNGVGSGSSRSRRGVGKKFPDLPEFNPATDMQNPHFELGLLFPNGDCLKKAIKEYAIKSGKDIYFKRNEPGRVREMCSRNKKCPWVCYATKMKGTNDFIIKTYNPVHKCSRAVRNRFATSKWLANNYADSLKSSQGLSVGEFVTQIKKDHVLDVSRQKAYRARKCAETLIEGSINEQFGVLWDYAEEIKTTNPGSTVLFKTELDESGHCLFMRIYICYAACKSGFNAGCRKLVSLDGCHLKSPHKGQLLTAIGIDANNSLFPIAFAVVEAECKDSWSWFLEILRDDINIHNSHHWTFISDKQKGLEQALKDMWGTEETAEHRHCARHVQQNFSKVFKGQQLKLKMMSTAMSCTVAKFKAHMEDIRQDDEKAYDWLMSKGPAHWCRAFFRTNVKCDILLNNLCETFNGTNSILTAREKPILSFLERIRMYILQRLTKQKASSTKWFLNIGPRICKILERSKKDAASNIAYWCGGQSYQVVDSHGTPFSVDLAASSCSCKRWDLSGLPCSHAIACIWHKQLEPEDYVCEWYKKEAFDMTYAGQINPIRAQEEWPVTNWPPIYPPTYKKQPGRPKKARRYEHDEVFPSGSTKMRRVYNKVHCKTCGLEGHNSRSCSNRPSQSQATHGRQQTSTRHATKAREESRERRNNETITNQDQTRRQSPRFKMTARKQVSPNFKTIARKKVNVNSARRLFEGR